MKKKESILLFLIILSAIVAGCGASDSDTNIRNWRTGTQAAEMRFQQGSPPLSVYDGDRVDFVLEMWNRGAFPLAGELYYTGFDPSIFIGIRPVIPFSITETKTQYNDEGGFTVIRANGRVHVPEGVDTFNTRISAIACYSYETSASIQVCIDPEPGKNDATDPCRPGSMGAGTQAAPVAVSSVDVESTPAKTIFRISVRNVGSGTILDEAKIRRCIDPDVTFADANWVDLVQASVGNSQFLHCLFCHFK